jgi:hypothetical protein
VINRYVRGRGGGAAGVGLYRRGWRSSRGEAGACGFANRGRGKELR